MLRELDEDKKRREENERPDDVIYAVRTENVQLLQVFFPCVMTSFQQSMQSNPRLVSSPFSKDDSRIPNRQTSMKTMTRLSHRKLAF